MKKIRNNHKIQIVMIFLFSFLLSACGESGQTDRENEINRKDEIEECAESESESEQEQESEPEQYVDELLLIEQEISEYRERFIELYTGNALNDTESQMNIEEFEIDYDGNNGGEPVTLIRYTDSYREVLRYQLHFYGETMHCSVNYYLCRDFVLVSKECDYYSSWVLTAGYSDVLYSSIENWIIFEDKVYILHDDGELEEIEEMQLEIPLIEEIEAYTK